MPLYGAATRPTTVAPVVDSTSGTVDGTLATLAAVALIDVATTGNAASGADVNARLTTINNNFADIAAKLNELLAILKK